MTHWRHRRDNLAPARGLINSAVIGAILWALVIYVIWRVN